MNITTDTKHEILKQLSNKRNNFTGSDAKFAVSIGINNAQYSRIKNGEFENVLSDSNWLRLARVLGLQLNSKTQWKTAKTPVFEYITTQLEFCQNNSVARILVDIPDIGKTYTAKEYVKSHKDAIYIDCSQCKTKLSFIRAIAEGFGLDSKGKYVDVYADLVYYLQTLQSPLVILDELGDLEYNAFLELKALWNITENICGWYAMGATGLRAKIEKGMRGQKVGYSEFFSRFGDTFQKVSPDNKEGIDQFKAVHAAQIIKANSDGGNVQKMVLESRYSLRRIPAVLQKQNLQAV